MKESISSTNFREENYQKAHYIIDTSELTEDDIVTKILGCIDETSS